MIHRTEQASLIDLSGIDFDALREHFEKGRKHNEAEKLRGAVSRKLVIVHAPMEGGIAVGSHEGIFLLFNAA